MNFKKYNKSIVIIGSSKIAKIHYNFFYENNFSKFYFVGRKKNKIDTFIKENNIKNANFLNKRYLKRSKSLISLCNNTNFHQDYLEYINSNKQILIVEKPLISPKIFKKNYLEKIKNYYKKFRKLVVVYPMIFLARSYNKFINIKNIKNIKIYYFTKGEHTYEDIYIDLLPHCLIFFKEFCRLKKKKLSQIIKINKTIKKNSNYIELVFNDVKLSIILKQRYIGKKSKFFFKINNKKYDRQTKEVKGNFKNYIKVKNKLIEIENPMTQFFNDTLKNSNKVKFFNTNKKLTFWLSNLTYKIFNS